MRVLTIDIGGTFIKCAVMTEEMEILERGKLSTPSSVREALVDALAGIYEETQPEA